MGQHLTGDGAQGSGATVRALTARPLAMRRMAFRERIAVSMWFVPTLFVAGAFGLSLFTLWLDSRLDLAATWLPAGTPGAAESLAATIAAGMLTFTAVVFSTTLVAIQLAGGQYSPRVVRVFVRSGLTHVTLGVFLATFVVATNVLVDIREGSRVRVPAITVGMLYVLVLATLAAFIAFASRIVRLLRVQYLLRTVAGHGRAAIDRYVPPAGAYRRVARPEPSAGARLVRNEGRSGVLISVDVHTLAGAARDAGGWVELVVQPGEYLGQGTPVARLHGCRPGEPGDAAVLGCLLLGGERTLVQDPGFALRQLVDIAARALSPAVNDPTTATQAVDRVTDLLTTCARRPDPTGWYADAAGTARVHVPAPDFARLADLGYTEIALYGAGAPQVTRRLLAAYDVLEGLVGPERVPVLEALRGRLVRVVREQVPEPFADVASRPDRLGLG